jgi:hypothetical protein
MTSLGPQRNLSITREIRILSRKEREPLKKRSRRTGSAHQQPVSLPVLQVPLLEALALYLTVSLQRQLPIVRGKLVVISINMRVRPYMNIQRHRSQMIGLMFPALKVASWERRST